MQYRKKPVVIDAVRYTGANADEIQVFGAKPEPTSHWGGACGEPQCKDNWNLIIPTLEGVHIASVGDWIIKGVEGEFYPCKDSIFQITYEPVDAAQSAG